MIALAPLEIIIVYLIDEYLHDSTDEFKEKSSELLKSIIIDKKPLDDEAFNLLSLIFRTSKEYWINIQNNHNNAVGKKND